MRYGIGVFVAVVVAAGGCGERRPKPATNGGGLHPAPPPPPGSVAVVGPLRIEGIDVVRSEIGWDRDLVRASRIVDYDVVLAQERGTCPKDSAPASVKDSVGCAGAVTLPQACTRETVRARLEVTVRWTIDVQQRCAGDVAPYAIPASGDPKPALAAAGAACFRNKNKFKPESTWASLYALTELDVAERIEEARTRAPSLLAVLSSNAKANEMAELGARAIFCRDDGAYLDGTPGTPSTTSDVPPAAAFVPMLVDAAPLAGEKMSFESWRSEQSLWELCQSPQVKDAIGAQERCQLLRQLDRFVRDVEDTARPETPKGAASVAPSASSSAKKGSP